MKTIADIKRKMKVGQVWACEQPGRGWFPGDREVVHLDSVGFAFKYLEAPDKKSYCDWPKKTEVEFISEKSFSVLRWGLPDSYRLFYTLIKD